MWETFDCGPCMCVKFLGEYICSINNNMRIEHTITRNEIKIVRIVGTEADLVRTLDQTPLPTWKTKTDALPQQFSRAAMAAVKLLEPKAQRVHLISGTLKTEQEVKAWLAGAEKDLLAKLKNGPVVIS